MKFIISKALGFTGILSLVIFVSFFGHKAIIDHQEINLNPSLLIQFYVVNWSLALLTAFVIIWAMKNKPEIAGFSFMGGSLVKFAIFFAVFFPNLSSEEALRKTEILGFYIPYALCLIAEVWYLVRQMNRLKN